jgi:hypothetical protein
MEKYLSLKINPEKEMEATKSEIKFKNMQLNKT